MAQPAEIWRHSATPATGTAGWRAGALALGAIGLVLALFHDTAWGIVQVWRTSETFTHGFLILPIVAFLVWYRRHELAAVPVRPWPWALAGVALAGFAWLVGAAGGVTGVQHFALAAMIPFIAWAVLGHAAVRVLAFPLAYLFLAVPFGAFLIQPLMVFTADFTVSLVRLSGIPVYREGMEFALPTGNWSVVEACSGIRYLIASFALGLLYAYLMYRTLWRQLLFMAAAIGVPILANGLRAYMIVMIGHHSGMEYAVGVDHLLYGWVFFGIVIALLFWIGTWWREDGAEMRFHEADRPAAGAVRIGPPALVAGAAVLVAAVWPLYAAQTVHGEADPVPALAAPASAGGWERMAGGAVPGDWRPGYAEPRASVHAGYQQDGESVGLFVGFYRDQTQHTEMLAYGHQLAPTQGQDWRRLGLWRGADRVAGIHPTEALLARNRGRMVGWRLYWVEGHWTASRVEVKARTALARLLNRGDATAVVVLYAPFDHEPTAARDSLAAFAEVMLPALESKLEEAAR